MLKVEQPQQEEQYITTIAGQDVPVRADGTFILEQELKKGTQEEERIRKIIDKKYKVSLKKLDQYNCMDFVSDKFMVEIKSRRNKLNTYSTTIIGKNKIDYCSRYLFTMNQFAWEEDKFKVLYVFAFEDGDYFIEHDEKWIKECEVKKITRNDGVGTKDKEHYLIPVKLLSPL